MRQSKLVGPILCLSLDFELILGSLDIPNKRYVRKFQGNTEIKNNINELVKLLVDYNIKCTWAIATHLFLDPIDEMSHMEAVKSAGTQVPDVNDKHLLYARGLVKKIVDTPHFEVGCHSFSHQLFDKISKEQARYELTRSSEVAREINPKLKFETFVFPQNRIGHRDLLVEYGYKAYRSTKARRQKPYNKVTKMWKELSIPKTVNPHVDSFGLVNIPSSMFLPRVRGKNIPKLASGKLFKYRIIKSLNNLASKGGLLHYWMHPYNYGTTLEKADIISFLEMVDEYKDKHNIQNLTMSEIANLVRRNE